MSRRAATLTSAAIAAAFVGPGTVTTCAKAGVAHGTALLWALGFAVAACFVLQEAAARLTAVTGRSLGEIIADRFPPAVRWLAAVAVVSGCAAYQAGNILGAVAGLSLVTELSPRLLTVAVSIAAATLLALGSLRAVTTALAALVAVMGVAFLTTAIAVSPSITELSRGLVVPSVPPGASLLVLALVGTTVVPYNLFLGSGLARGHQLDHTRSGLAVSIAAGGLISMSILAVGTAAAGTFSFANIASVLSDTLGPWARHLFAVGLAAAGLTSAVTAPLAAAVTARSLFSNPSAPSAWDPRSPRFRAVWIAVLGFGAAFGISDVKPVPAILLAQSLNGLLLPLVAILLWRLGNDRQLLGTHTNGRLANLATALTVALALALGARALTAAAATLFGA